jgi:hypothetical protein
VLKAVINVPRFAALCARRSRKFNASTRLDFSYLRFSSTPVYLARSL